MDSLGYVSSSTQALALSSKSTHFIHKVIRGLSTILHARPIAFIHLSTYTTTATI